MGIVNPRPAMRRGEERRIRNILEHHAMLRHLMASNGVESAEADKIAAVLARTSIRRKLIWRAK